MNKPFVTYRRVDGELIQGRYSFVMSLEGLEDEGTDVVEERWILDEKRLITQTELKWDDDEFDHLYEEDEEGVRKFKEQ